MSGVAPENFGPFGPIVSLSVAALAAVGALTAGWIGRAPRLPADVPDISRRAASVVAAVFIIVLAGGGPVRFSHALLPLAVSSSVLLLVFAFVHTYLLTKYSRVIVAENGTKQLRTAGSQLTENAQREIAKGISQEQLIGRFRNQLERIWTAESIHRNQLRFACTYPGIILFAAVGLSSATLVAQVPENRDDCVGSTRDWVKTAKEWRASGVVDANRPPPSALISARARFELCWTDAGLATRQSWDRTLVYEALALSAQTHRLEEQQSETKPTAMHWADEAIRYYEELGDRKYLVDALLDMAAILLEISQVEHTDPVSWQEMARRGDTVLARAAGIASDAQKADTYRIWSRFYYNLARPTDLSKNWDNNYLLPAYDKALEAFRLAPSTLPNATQLARAAQKAAANPPQDTDPAWTEKLRDAKIKLTLLWKDNGTQLTTPTSRIPPLNTLSVIIMDSVRRDWESLGAKERQTRWSALNDELENAVTAEREAIALIRHTEWEEEYDFDRFYDLARLQCVQTQLLLGMDERNAHARFLEAKTNMEHAKAAATAMQLASAQRSVDTDPNMASLPPNYRQELHRALSLDTK